MRKKDPKRMEEILHFAQQHYLESGRSPSTAKIADSLGIAKATVYRYLIEMDACGMLSYDGQTIMTEVTKKLDARMTKIALIGEIACGAPQYQEEHIEAYVSLPTTIVGKGDFFMLRANGDSMIEAGIADGDLVVVRRQVEAQDGDIVVALVENQNTLKRFFRDKEGDRIILHPENKDLKDIVVEDCAIQGVACHVIKAL